MMCFAVLVAAAIVKRRVPSIHKRLMLAIMIAFVAPAVARRPLPDILDFPALMASDLLLVPLIVHDLRHEARLHRATVLGGLALIAWRVVPVAVWDTPAWLAFTTWAAGGIGCT